jgi:hypothetical protein
MLVSVRSSLATDVISTSSDDATQSSSTSLPSGSSIQCLIGHPNLQTSDVVAPAGLT